MRFAFASSAHRPPDEPFADTLRPGTCHGRLEVCPPRVLRRRSWYARLADWLRSGWPWAGAASPMRLSGVPAGELEAVRRDFIEAVEDLRSDAAEALLDHIHDARGLRELWHLRAEVFRVVALQHSQLEAGERLAWLNRHFPTRAPRSGFGPLAGSPASAHPRQMWP